MNETRRYVFKLYPTAPQADIFHIQRKMCADLWNAMKQRIEDTYRRERRMLSYFDLTNEITQLRAECPEWAVVPAVTSQRVAKWLTDSYQAFFRRLKAGEEPGYPQWRRRDQATTIPLGTMDKTGWRVEQRDDNPRSWRLHYKSVSQVKDRTTWIHARGRLPDNLQGDPAWIGEYRNGDIIWRDGAWWLSICVDIEGRRLAGRKSLTVEFDLIDGIAKINGRLEPADDIADMRVLAEDIDRLKSQRDIAFPRGKKLTEQEREQLGDLKIEISRLSAYAARRRKDFLHVFTARLVARASDITLLVPPVKVATKSPRGNAKDWGANVETVSRLNRHVLSFAPAMAIAMLEYKAKEAGIRCDVVRKTETEIAVGEKLVAAGKAQRKSKRAIRRQEWESSTRNSQLSMQ